MLFFEIWRTLNPWSDVASSFDVLHQRFTLAILSNMSIATQAALTGHPGLPFDRTLSAESVRMYKPNPTVYKMAIASLGLRPDDIMLVVAHDYDLKAAQSEGFRTAYVAREGEQGSPDASFDINVTSFNDLPKDSVHSPDATSNDRSPNCCRPRLLHCWQPSSPPNRNEESRKGGEWQQD
jgi:2-haloacid dehalogenase